MSRHAPRSGMGGEVGEVFRRDEDSPVMVMAPVAIECDFWICTLRPDADNQDHFFGPVLKQAVLKVVKPKNAGPSNT